MDIWDFAYVIQTVLHLLVWKLCFQTIIVSCFTWVNFTSTWLEHGFNDGCFFNYLNWKALEMMMMMMCKFYKFKIHICNFTYVNSIKQPIRLKSSGHHQMGLWLVLSHQSNLYKGYVIFLSPFFQKWFLVWLFFFLWSVSWFYFWVVTQSKAYKLQDKLEMTLQWFFGRFEMMLKWLHM